MNPVKRVIPNAIMLGEVSRMLDEGHSVVIMTKGASMSPFIRGERDSVELVKQPSYAVGDIVLAQIAPGHYVLHRIHSMDGEDIVLKGDGNLDGTEKCKLANLCGTAVAVLRPGGRKLDCTTKCARRMFRRWVSAPRIVRRIVLGFYRRIKIL